MEAASRSFQIQFPHPPVKLSDLKAGLEDFDSSCGKVLDGGKKAFAEKKKCRGIVIKMLVQLGQYVESVAENDMALFLLSGFEPAGKSPTQKVIDPRILKITYGKSGELLAWYLAFYRQVIHYQLRYRQQGPDGGLPDPWTETRTLRQARKPASVTGLTPGKIYCFQVWVFKNDETFTDWSPTVTRMSK